MDTDVSRTPNRRKTHHMTDRDTFIDAIFADKTDDELICVTRGEHNSDGKTFFANSLNTDRGYRNWDSENTAAAWYFCVSTIDGARKIDANGEEGRVMRGRANLQRVHCLVLDDVGTKATEPPVQPSWKIETSAGNYQWGYMLEPTDRFPEYEALVDWCAEQGWADAGAGGSYRVMRVPGSANLKPGRDGFRSTVTHWDPVFWQMDTLASDLGCDLGSLDVRKATMAVAGGGAAPMDGVDVLLDWLGDNGQVVEDNGGEWVTVKCPWAGGHTSGNGTASYSPLGRGSDGFVERRSFSCLHEHCKNNKTGNFIERHGEAGAPAVSGFDPLPWLQERYAYIEGGQQVADLKQRLLGGVWLWELADWKLKHPGKIAIAGHDRPILIANAWIENSQTKRAVGTKYLPVRRDVDNPGLVEDKGQSYVNTFKHPTWPATEAAPDVFLEHMAYLIPDEMERRTFIDWLAYKVQNPDKRSFCVLMVAENVYGTGRSWLKDMVSLAIGGGVNTASLGQLIGKGTSAEQTFNDWMAECQFVVVEEAKDNSTDMNDFYHGFESFKELVDTKVSYDRRINPKYGRTRFENVYFNALIFTNHADALAIPEGDRRVMVVENATERNSAEYYERLHGALGEAEAGRLYWWLMSRDLTHFDHVYPPETNSKYAMIQDTESPVTSVGYWIRDNWPVDLVTRDTLRDAIMDASSELGLDRYTREPGVLVKPLWRQFKSLSLTGNRNGRRVRDNGRQKEVRAVRNRNKWLAIDHEKLPEGL